MNGLPLSADALLAAAAYRLSVPFSTHNSFRIPPAAADDDGDGEEEEIAKERNPWKIGFSVSRV